MRKNLKIIAACQDIGGCNAIYPVIEKMRRSGHSVCLYASSYSVDILRKKRLEFYEVPRGNFNSVSKIFDKENPDIVLLGTSMGFSLEDALLKESRKRGSKTVAIFDSWVNYSLRFVDPLDKATLNYLPDYICVSDNFVKNRMEKEGIPEKRIIVTGNPYFDDLLKDARNYTAKTKDRLLEDYNVPSDTIIVSFFSQRIDKTFGSRKTDKGFLGYTQFDALKLLITALKSFYADRNVLLIIRPHPKEDTVSYAKFTKRNRYLRVVVSNKEEPRKIIAISDIVCGMFSVTLVEAYLLKKKILSIQPNLKAENPFILHHLGLVESLGTGEEVLKQLVLFAENKGSTKIKNFFNTGKGTQNVIDLIYKVTQGK